MIDIIKIVYNRIKYHLSRFEMVVEFGKPGDIIGKNSCYVIQDLQKLVLTKGLFWNFFPGLNVKSIQ
jgi:hypothetical protein